jgi:hypothetical protein
MHNVARLGLVCLVLGLTFLPAQANDTDSNTAKPAKSALPESVRSYIAKKYFDDCEPGDPRIPKAVEVLKVPDAILRHIRKNKWEAGQLDNFATDKLQLILTTPAGEVHSLVFRDGKKRKDRKLTPGRARVLRRLYGADAFVAPEAEVLTAARKLEIVKPIDQLEAAIKALDDKHQLDDETLKRARKNLAEAKDGGRELAIGLAALADSEHPVANQWAGVWLISRMDKMTFWREHDKGSIHDLQCMDARTFYENVFYATKARLEFPWGRKCKDTDFLQQVLSPRGTGEPLQRWRKHFFCALEPELKNIQDADKAIALARGAAYDFFQYYGDTTWEDFGMLTALAVHEGRCEDCSNVENCMLRAAGLPAAQAFTPWWGRGNGNHAWTVIPSIDGGKNGNGRKAVKVYLKTWDKLEDITAVNTKVIDLPIELDEGVKGEKAGLKVWNADEWRLVARSRIEGDKVTFKDVGAKLPFVLMVSAKNSSDRLLTIVDGKVTLLNNTADTKSGKDAFALKFDKSCDLGEFEPDEEYTVLVQTRDGWQEIESERLSTGALSFECDPHRLYHIEGHGINARPFTATAGEDGPVVTRF